MVRTDLRKRDADMVSTDQSNVISAKDLQMKSLIIAFAIALSLTVTGAFAHGDEHEAGKEKHGEGHADALGKPGDPKKISRTIEVLMSDAMRFSPANIKVKRGETIKFVLTNA